MTDRELVERAREVRRNYGGGVYVERVEFRGLAHADMDRLLSLAARGAEVAGATEAWRVDLTCCGRDAGSVSAETWEKAEAFRESYTTGPGVAPHGYSSCPTESGHHRSGVIRRVLILPAASSEVSDGR